MNELSFAGNSQFHELLTSYGKAMYFTHTIEDMLKLLLREAARFNINGYEVPKSSTKLHLFEEIIKQFVIAFPNAEILEKRLTLLRKILNKLAHALVLQVGSDLLTEEGRDQVGALLGFVNK